MRTALVSARPRDEIDLDGLTEEPLAVVVDTMEPAQMSLWLKQREFSGEAVR